MTDNQSPPKRVAATLQLYAILKQYLDRPTWTPIEGALVMSGIHPPGGCTEIPIGGTGLDGLQFTSAANDRFHSAFRIMDAWQLRREDDEADGDATPTALTPYEFIRWCEDSEIQTDWMHLILDIIYRKSQAGMPDLIPSDVADHAIQMAKTIDTIRSVLGASSDFEEPNVASSKKSEQSLSRSPMPIPQNRDHVSTGELAAILAVDPQSIRKRHSTTGSYHGIRPTKLPNRLLLWPVEAIRALLD